ncbi:Crp/Fnr family transcriptional regulator [Thermodesulfobacteriota bacterium]
MLYLSSVVPTKPGIYNELGHFFTPEEMEEYCFPDLETALSKAEDDLLNSLIENDHYKLEIPIEKLDAFELFNDKEIKVIQKYLTKKIYREQEQIIWQGETGNSIYFIVKGRAQTFQTKWNGNRQYIGTLCPGTTIGEMAIIDQRPRSADVIVVEELVCFYITTKEIEQLAQEHPLLSYKILKGVAKELSKRLRIKEKIYKELTEKWQAA